MPKQISAKESITIKHLAQVFLDSEIRCTPLEGTHLVEAISFIEAFLDRVAQPAKTELDQLIILLAKRSFNKTGDTAENLKTLLSHMKDLVKIEKQLKELGFDYFGNTESAEKILLQLSKISLPILESLEKKKDVFIPGGWAGRPGHQMIYRLMLNNQTKKIIFLVYNTGSGISFQGSTPLASGKQGFFPVSGMEFSSDEDPEKLVAWLNQLLNLQVLPLVDSNVNYNAEDFYLKILKPALFWLNAKPIPARQLANPVLGQRSGTCTFKSLKKVMQAHFDCDADFRLFFMAYRLDLLQKEIQPEKLEIYREKAPSYIKLFKRSLGNLVRMLDPQLKSYIKDWKLEELEKRQLLLIFSTWKEALNLKYDKTNKETIVAGNYLVKPPKKTEISWKEPYGKIYSNANKKENYFYYEPEKQSFYAALKTLNSLSVSHDRFCEFIERFCFVFSDINKPLLDDKKISAEEFLLEMEKLLKRYMICRSDITPRSVIIYLSLMFILDRLCEDKCFVFGEVSLSCVPIYANRVKEFVTILTNNPFFGTQDVRFDVMLKRLQDFYVSTSEKYLAEKKSDAIENRLITYYCNIVNASPLNEKKHVENLWKIDCKNSLLIIELKRSLKISPQSSLSYLMNRDKLTAKTPYLNKAFNKQERIETFLNQCLKSIMVITHNGVFWQKQKLDSSVKQIKIYKISHPNSYVVGLENILFSYSKNNGDFWLLKPKFLQKNFKFNNSSVENVLTSHYDNNAFDSNEVSLNLNKSTFEINTYKNRSDRSPVNSAVSFRSEEQSVETLLHHINLSPHCQVVSVLSALTQKSSWLSDENFQKYILLTIFQPGVLLVALRDSIDLEGILEKLMQLNHFSEDPCFSEKAEWFLLKLIAYISVYALQAQKLGFINLESQLIDKFCVWQEKMLGVCRLRLVEKEQNYSLTDLKEIYYFKILTLYYLGVKDKQGFFELLDAYLIISFLPKEEKIGFILEEEKQQAFLEIICDYLGMEFKKNADLVGEIPSLMANVLKRCQFWDAEADKNLWECQAKVSIFPLLILKDNKSNELIINFANRMITYNKNQLSYVPMSLILSPQYREIFGIKPWLARKTLIKLHDNELANCYLDSKNGYRILHRLEMRLDKPTYYFQRNLNGMWHTLLAPSKDLAKEFNFEDYAFTTAPVLFNQVHYRIWAHKKGYLVEDILKQEICYTAQGGILRKKGKFDGKVLFVNSKTDKFFPDLFLRLEDKNFIEYIQDSKKGECWYFPRYDLTFIKKEGSYQTEDEDYLVELPNENQGFFKSGLVLRSKDIKKPSVYLVPLQPFYLDQEKSQEKSPQKTHHTWIHNFSNHLAERSLSGQNEENPTSGGWDFDRTEQMVSFLIQGEELIAVSTADKIYLAYLYLIQDRPKKAYEILNSCQFIGSPEEVERLWWIISKLTGKSKLLINSRLLAVKLLVMHSLMLLITQYPSLSRVMPIENKLVSNTVRYKEIDREKLQDFLSNFAVNLKTIYVSYDNHRNNIPATLRLQQDQELLLLSYMQAKGGINAYASVLGTRYLENFSLPNQKAVSTYNSLTSLRGKKPVSPANWSSYGSLGIYKEDEKISSQEAWENLSPWMSPRNLGKYFQIYYQAARHTNYSAVYKNKLINFCQATVNYSDSANLEARVFCLSVAEALWVVLHVPDKFPEKCSEFFEENVAHINYDALFGKLKGIINTIDMVKAVPPFEFEKESEINILYSPEVKSKYLAPSIVNNSMVVREKEQDLLLGLLLFKDCYTELKKLESQYETYKKAILLQLEKLSTLNFEKQVELFNELDSQLLAYQNKKLDSEIKLYKENQGKLWEEIANLEKVKAILVDKHAAQEGIINGILQTRERSLIAELGKQIEPLSLALLIKNYAKTKLEDYLAWGIPETRVPDLQEALENLFALANEEKRLTSLIEALVSDKKNSTQETQLQVISALISKNQAIVKEEAVFQYLKKLSLRPGQAQLLALMIESRQSIPVGSYVMQLIMGGGKTKVILPIFLNILANKDSLVIVMVPEMLLSTNFGDLQATSRQVYGQSAFFFHFERESACDPASLQNIYENFDITRKHQGYLVSAPSSFQSLKLKYFEILYQRIILNQESQETEEQLKWLDKIFILLEEKGVVIIDEGRQLLFIRNELNYGIGLKLTIDRSTIETIMALYAWLKTIPVQVAEKQRFLVDFIKDPNIIGSPSALKQLIEFYIKCLSDENLQPGWLQALLLYPLTVTDLQNFLQNKTSEADEKDIYKVLDNFPSIKAQWILLREEFNVFLLLTLPKKLRENYGPGLDAGNPFAVPFRANNVATPFVFANFIETINYTIQMFYCEGISFAAFKNLLTDWQTKARLQRKANSVTISIAERMFNELFKEKVSLLKFNLEDEVYLRKMHAKYGHEDLLIQIALKEYLNQLTIDAAILRCDAINLVGMFGDAYVVSGTPDNYRTYHPKLKFLGETSLLVETQLKECLKNKKTAIKKVATDLADLELNTDKFIEQCMLENKNIRALIDCGAQLRGLSNLEVAKKLSKALQKYHSSVRYVLFYQADSLYAWNIHASEQQEPKKLTNTDADTIKKELDDCPLEERFTYYDQEHTLGADILQAEQAWAVVTVDFVTDMSKFLQAVARMRGIYLSQEVTIFLVSGMKVAFEGSTALDDLYSFLSKNQIHQLKEDHFPAATKQIDNVFHEDLFKRLIRKNNINDKDNLFLDAKKFFVEFQTANITALYQQKSILEVTAKGLMEFIKITKKEWQDIVIKLISSKGDLEKTEKNITPQLNFIYERSVKSCEETQYFSRNQCGREVQQQKQQQKENQKESQKQAELSASSLASRDLNLNWIKKLNVSLPASSPYSEQVNLAKLMGFFRQSWGYDSNIYATENFLYSFVGQAKEDIYNVYTKPVIGILFFLDRAKDSIQALLICPEEAEELQILLSSPQNANSSYWLATLYGECFTRRPILTNEQQSKINNLLAQMAFFNGRIDILISSPLPPWMLHKGEQKLNFFKNNMQPFLNISDDQFIQLESQVINLEHYVEQWARYPLSAGIFSCLIENVSEGIKKRLTQILNCLNETRSNSISKNSLVIKSVDGLPIHDGLIVKSYQKAFKVLLFLQTKDYAKAARHFQNEYDDIPLGFLDYYLGQQQINLQPGTAMQMLNYFNDDLGAKQAWIERILASARISLSFNDFYHCIVAITDVGKILTLFRSFLINKKDSEKDLSSAIDLLANYEENIINLKDDYLFSLILLKRSKIMRLDFLQEAMLNPRFSALIQLLAKTNLLSEEVLLYFFGKEIPNLDIIEHCLNYLFSHGAIPYIEINRFFNNPPWAELTILADSHITDLEIIKAILNNNDFRESVAILGKNSIWRLEFYFFCINIREEVLAIFKKRLEFLRSFNLINEVKLDFLLAKKEWNLINELRAQQFFDQNLIKLIALDPGFVTVMNYFLTEQLIGEVNIQALCDAWPNCAVKFLIAENKDKNIIKKALANAHFNQVLLTLKKYDAFKEDFLIKLLNHDEKSLSICLNYLESNGLVLEKDLNLLEDKNNLKIILALNNLKVKEIHLIRRVFKDPCLAQALMVLARLKPGDQLLDDVVNDSDFISKLAAYSHDFTPGFISSIKMLEMIKRKFSQIEYAEMIPYLRGFIKEIYIKLLDHDGKELEDLNQSGKALNEITLSQCLAYFKDNKLITDFKTLEEKYKLSAILAIEEWQIKDAVLIKKIMSDLETFKALKFLWQCKLNDLGLMKDILMDAKFKEWMLSKNTVDADNVNKGLSAETIEGIKAIYNVKKRYIKKYAGKDTMNSIDAFALDAYRVLLDNDGKDKALAEKQISHGLSTAAEKHFKHKAWKQRILADILLTLSVIGLLVFVGRKISGRSFFFSTQITNRQKNFEQSVASIIAAKTA